MTMTYESEFQTVDVLLQSTAETLGVDTFALSIIKAERQARRLVTNLVFQYPCFSDRDVSSLRATLSASRSVYFEGFVRGFAAISPRSMRQILGADYDRLYQRLNDAIGIRNKIFHGQLTDQYLTREELLRFVADIRLWCGALATGCDAEFGYDGFGRNSFRKSGGAAVAHRLLLQFTGVESYKQFIENFMERR